MPDYKTMYFKLAAKVADAVELLIDAQKQGEESYISDESNPPIELQRVFCWSLCLRVMPNFFRLNCLKRLSVA